MTHQSPSQAEKAKEEQEMEALRVQERLAEQELLVVQVEVEVLAAF